MIKDTHGNSRVLSEGILRKSKDYCKELMNCENEMERRADFEVSENGRDVNRMSTGEVKKMMAKMIFTLKV